MRLACQGGPPRPIEDEMTMPDEEFVETPQIQNWWVAGIDPETYDPMIKDKIALLEKAKEEAVLNEDYEEAKWVKIQCDKVKMIGASIVQLEWKQKLAVENEDFDSAQIIKFELDKLK